MPDCRVLIVDDDVTTLDLVDTFLRYEGYAPLLATSGSQALLLAEQFPPDLVFLDWWMPGLSGSEVARTLRSQTKRVPIVAFTAATYSQVEIADFDLDGYLAKPFDLTDLLAVVERYCQSMQVSA